MPLIRRNDEVDICEPWPDPWPHHRSRKTEYTLSYARGYALLPTGKRINPSTGVGFYSEPGQQSIEIVRSRHDGSIKALTTFGRSDRIPGDQFPIQHDQTMRFLGDFEVIGVKLNDGRTAGFIPTKTVPHWVYK